MPSSSLSRGAADTARFAAACPSGDRAMTCTRDAQRRHLGCGEAAQVHHLATVLQLRQVGLGLAELVEVHAEVC